MKYKVICSCVFVTCLTFAECVTNQTTIIRKSHTNNYDNGDGINEIRRPQMSTLERFRFARQAYTIFENVDLVEYFRNAENNSNVVNQTSPNYPEPYPVGQTLDLNVTVANATGIEINLHFLDMDPTSDFLRLTVFSDDKIEKKSFIFTGNLKQPMKLRALGFTLLEITFDARTASGHSYKGYLLSYQPYGDLLKPIVAPPDIKTPFNELKTISLFIVVKKEDQNVTTWSRLKELLCQATNNFVSDNSSKLELCSSHNVTFTRITSCPSFWPNKDNCIELTFAITLYNNRSKMHDPIDPFFEDITPRVPAGLNETELELMWNLYGRTMLDDEGINEYHLPDTRMTILMWVGITIGIVVLCFIIFVAIFRIPNIQERWIEDESPPRNFEEVIENKPDDDITMFPSPDQILPDFYQGPSSQNYNYGYSTNINEGRDVSLIAESSRSTLPGFEAINEGMELDDESNYNGDSNIQKANVPTTHQVRF